MRLYDTARRKVVTFEPGHVVTMYTCGITPYDAAHLGHAATYLAYDVLQRRLRDLGHETRCVRNITDVDDDILRKARSLRVHYLDLAAEEVARFDEHMAALGLLPAWADDPKIAARCFNARAESVATKPMFRSAFRRRRLLVPVDGFYEWAHIAGRTRKQPYFFHRADGEPVVLAGLWERWARDGEERLSATVITCPAGPDMPVHDRQPVVLERDTWELWLDPDHDDRAVLDPLLRPSSGVLVHHAVSPDVGSVRNDGPELVLPLGATA